MMKKKKLYSNTQKHGSPLGWLQLQFAFSLFVIGREPKIRKETNQGRQNNYREG